MLQMRTLDDLCKSAVNALGINGDRKDCPTTGESAMASTTYSTAQPRVASRNGTCTHLTMTRLYTDEFRCLICLRMSSMGWVWRCTQDRDMMLEDEANFEDSKLDSICDLIPRSDKPRMRSPAARALKLSFLNEINEADLKTYTPAQLIQILTQREHVLQVAKDETQSISSDNQSTCSLLSAGITSEIYASTPSSRRATSGKLPKKIWMPPKDSECQFKCCHYCRPSLVDRSYLSLDEIANGGISPSAAAGFGFHLMGKRPVALVKHVKNLGLRPSPLVPDHPSKEGQRITSRLPATISKLTRSLFESAKALSSSTSVARPSKGLESQPDESTFPHRRNLSDTAKFELALHTPLPVQSPEELALITGPPTPMEESERTGMFGSAPLDLERGVAVTEEAVKLHVPDLITQL